MAENFKRQNDSNQQIQDRVHSLYWEHGINCAGTMLTCLSELFNTSISEQTLNASIGLHGAGGGLGAQCGLVEGALMFIGIYFSEKGTPMQDVISMCYQYASQYTDELVL